MNTAELGHRIKEARIAKKMTQSQVVGNFITRNMLSQIENGTAMPSIKTLTYLAEVLNIPDILDFSSGSDLIDHFDCVKTDTGCHGELLSQTPPEIHALNLLSAAKSAARAEDWLTIIAMEDSFPEIFSDEFWALFAQAFLALAKSSQNNPALAITYLEKSLAYAGQGLYANAARKAEAILLMQQLASKLTA